MSSSFTWDVKKKMEKLSNLRKIISFIFTRRQGDKNKYQRNVTICYEREGISGFPYHCEVCSLWHSLLSFGCYILLDRVCALQNAQDIAVVQKICIECATWKNSRHIVGICFFTFLLFIFFFLYKLCAMKENIWRHKNEKQNLKVYYQIYYEAFKFFD